MLEDLNNYQSNHPIVRHLLHRLHELNNLNGKIVELCWIPSHVGIRGNEQADREAVIAASLPEENISIYYKDFMKEISRAFNIKRKQEWSISTQKFRSVRPTLDY